MRTALLAALIAVQATNTQRLLDGIWTTDGYGHILEITSDSIKTFEVTRVSCIAGETLTAVPTPPKVLAAGRLTATTYTAYVKQARNDPNDVTKWTAPQTSLVQATSRPGFRGPVVQLIGVQSVSAAETFTQALLGRQPKVTRVGENTQGVFSDVLQRRLPNGWTFVLPNERFVTDGKSYDIVGIAPDVVVESLTPAARATGKDAAIEKAIELLRKS